MIITTASEVKTGDTLVIHGDDYIVESVNETNVLEVIDGKYAAVPAIDIRFDAYSHSVVPPSFLVEVKS